MRQLSKKEKIFYRFSQLLSILSIACLSFFIFTAIKNSFIPNKFILIIGISLVIVDINFFIVSFFGHSNKTLFIFDILMILLAILQIFFIVKSNHTADFLEKNFVQKNEIYEYYVLASQDSEYTSLNDVDINDIYLFQDIEMNETLNNKIESKLNKNLIFEEDLSNLLINTSEQKDYISVLDSEIYALELEEDSTLNNKIKIIDKFTIELIAEKDNNKIQGIATKPFIVYISGIDTRGNGMPARSLSDVNIYMVVNPLENKVLLIHTPRDAYVQLHGTTGLKDKLTHAGSRGGIKLSKSTMTDFMGYKPDYYIRVNFHAVENLVNAVGGLTVYNDMNYTVRSHIDSGCTFKPGYTNVDGRCAIAFARERKSYTAGDAHRGENQEQIIKLLIEKVSSSRSLINNYENILKALDGTIDTDLTKEDISDLVKMQLNDMKSWTVEAQNITGEGELTYTYSYPSQRLWVMHVNQQSLKQAQSKIREYLNTEN